MQAVVAVESAGLAHLPDQNATAREHLRQPDDDRLQQRAELVVGGCSDFDERRQTVGTAPAPTVRRQAAQVHVEVGGGSQALDQRDGAAVAHLGLQPGVVRQVRPDHALRHLQHHRDQLGLRSRQRAQRDRQRQHPLPHRHVGDDVLHQVRVAARTT
jgi:hypothetical protein